MYIYQDGKLYVERKGGLVGVNFISDSAIEINGTQTKLGNNPLFLTHDELRLKFSGQDVITHKEPIVEIKLRPKKQVKPKPLANKATKEVVANEPTRTTKRPSRKSNSK